VKYLIILSVIAYGPIALVMVSGFIWGFIQGGIEIVKLIKERW